VHGGDERLVEVDERLHQARLGRLPGLRRILQKLHHIVAGTGDLGPRRLFGTDTQRYAQATE